MAHHPGMERAGLVRVLIDPQRHAENPLDVLYRPADIHERAVGMGGRNRQALRLHPNPKPLIILLSWAELLSELIRGQIMTVLGTGRAVELLEQSREPFLVMQRQADGQAQAARARYPSNRLRPRRRSRDMTVEELSFHRPGGVYEQQRHGHKGR